jgi:Rieske Fe-S protein
MRHQGLPKIRFFLAIAGLSVGFLTCKEEEDLIPYVPVNKYVYLSENPELSPIGGAIYIQNAGVNGIILYRESESEFRAFDRTCTHEPQGSCAVTIDAGNLSATCPCCQSEFYLVFQGDVKKGPARYPLHQYQTSFNGEIIHIYN